MKAVYKQLIEIKVTHDYYDSGNCSDFLFEPTNACVKLLKRNHIYFKQTLYGFMLIYQPSLGEDGKPIKPYNPYIPIDSSLALDFKIILKNKFFDNFTNLPQMSLSGDRDILFFNNNLIDDSEPLNTEVVKLRPEVFERSFTSLTSSFATIEIDNSAGDVVCDEVSAAIDENTDSLTGKKTYSFKSRIDTSGLDLDLYTLKISVANINEKFYPCKSLIKDNAFGIVRILCDSSNGFDFEKGKTFNIAFSRKSVQWKYYIVCNNSYSKLKILENSKTPQVYFEEVFPAPSDKIKLFKSVTSGKVDQPLPFSESPKKGIQLLNDTTVLVENLPNPSINDPNGEKYIYV